MKRICCIFDLCKTGYILLFLLVVTTSGCSSRSALTEIPVNSEFPASNNYESKADLIVAKARSLIGTPYKWGGTSPKTGFDCSGFVWYVYKTNGIDLPRTTYEIYSAGSKVSGDIKSGDIIFYKVAKKKKSLHAGIATGDGTFVHSPSSGKTVEESSFSNPYWKKHFLGARRFF